MRIAVTHQKPRYEYDMFREKPDLPFLRQMLNPPWRIAMPCWSKRARAVRI